MKDRHQLSKARYFNLIRELNHPAAERRHRALEELLESRDPRSAGPATRRLFDADPRIRELAGALLAHLDLSASSAAVAALYDKGESARHRACEQLGAQFRREMPGPHHAAIATAAAGLQEFYEDLAIAAAVHDNSYVRRAATEGLHQCNHPALASTFLMPAADTDWMVRRYAAVGLSENRMSPMASQLQNDPHPETRSAARRAWARPGEPILVRDPHRRDMDASATFAFPACGSSALGDSRMPRLRFVARAVVASAEAGRAISTLYFLRETGASHSELEESLAGRQEPRLLAFLDRHRSPSTITSQRTVPESNPALLHKRVLVVGGDGTEQHMLDALRTAGADPEWISGFKRPASYPVRLDLVVLVWRRVSHALGDHAAKIAAQAKAPLVHARTSSAGAVLGAALDGLCT